MKISRKLQNKIQDAVADEVSLVAEAIDREFREDSISHEVWVRLHNLACSRMHAAPRAAIREIEFYRA